MEELLRYFMDETNRRLGSIEQKLEDLQSFKVAMLTSASVRASVISVSFGVLTLLVTLWASK